MTSVVLIDEFPTNTIVKLHDKMYQTVLKAGVDTSTWESVIGGWLVGPKLRFIASSQKWDIFPRYEWVRDVPYLLYGPVPVTDDDIQRELSIYFDLIPFDGVKPPFIYAKENANEGMHIEHCTTKVDANLASLIGLPSGEGYYTFTLKTDDIPYVYEEIANNCYTWCKKVDNGWYILDPYCIMWHTELGSCDLNCLNYLNGYYPNREEFCKSFPWFQVFEIRKENI